MNGLTNNLLDAREHNLKLVNYMEQYQTLKLYMLASTQRSYNMPAMALNDKTCALASCLTK